MASAKYAAARWRDFLPWVVLTIALAVADVYRDISWWFWAGLVAGFISTEVTKWRMRKLNREFAPHLPWFRQQEGDEDAPA